MTIAGIVAVFLVVGFVGSYLYFYIVNKGLIDKIQETREASQDLDKTIKEKENSLIISQRRIGDFSSILQEHKYIYNIFDFVDKNTIPAAWFYGFDFDQNI